MKDYLMEDHKSMATRMTVEEYTTKINQLYKPSHVIGLENFNESQKQKALSFTNLCKK